MNLFRDLDVGIPDPLDGVLLTGQPFGGRRFEEEFLVGQAFV